MMNVVIPFYIIKNINIYVNFENSHIEKLLFHENVFIFKAFIKQLKYTLFYCGYCLPYSQLYDFVTVVRHYAL